MSTVLRFTVAEYDRVIEQGVLADRHDQRLELIHGEIREMTPPNPPHEDTIDLLMYWSVDNAPRDRVRVRIQNYWIVNLIDLCIEVRRKPRNGQYHQTQIYHLGQSLSPLAFPEITLDVGYVFAR